MDRRYKTKRRKKRLIKLSAFVLIVCVAVILHIKYNVHPVIRTITRESVQGAVTETVNESAALVMSQTVRYSDIIKTQVNEAGDIVMISANPLTVNELARGVTLLVQADITRRSAQVAVPVGSLTGMPFLSGKGKTLRFEAIPVGTATTDFVSQFKAQGINQTLHKILMNVHVRMNVVIPGIDIDVETITQVLIAESVIVGKVPDAYLHSDSLDEMLNLIP